MMMEQQTVLSQTCSEVVEKVIEAFKTISKRLRDIFEKLKELFNSIKYTDYQSYPHSYPHCVDNLKVNTVGFPLPITRCARSRC